VSIAHRAAPLARISISAVLVSVAIVGCGGNPPGQLGGTPATTAATGSTGTATVNASIDRANAVLTKYGQPAEDSYYSCLLNERAQGIAFDQIINDCATKLLGDSKKGFGGELGSINTSHGSFFDPQNVSKACNPGDPEHSQGENNFSRNGSGRKTVGDYGDYTWGRDVSTQDPRGVGVGAGLTEEKAKAEKEAAVEEAERALEAFDKALAAWSKASNDLKAAKESGDAKKTAEATATLAKAKADLDKKTADATKKSDKAKQDPNMAGVSRTAGDTTPCEEALASAREILRECVRNGWKSAECRKLQARTHHCPDPTLILVDPEAGYVCGAKPDEKALKAAWVARCEQLARPGPDSEPCKPPKYDANTRVAKGYMGGVCNDPHAMTDPDGTLCQATFQIGKEFGAIDINKIIVLGMSKLGGPVIVLPNRNPPPPHNDGPQPRPGPHS
jgi:hypothetical protein